MRALEPEISRERDLSTAVSENPTVIRRPFSREPLRIFAQTLYFCKLESLTYILPLTVWVNLYSIFGTLRKTIFFARVRFDRSRASKVIDCGTNRKRVCDFLLVRHSDLGPILHRFGDIAGFCAHSVSSRNVGQMVNDCRPTFWQYAKAFLRLLLSNWSEVVQIEGFAVFLMVYLRKFRK